MSSKLNYFILSLLLVSALASELTQQEAAALASVPYATMPFPNFATSFQYPVEMHEITTEDGYILTFFRIQAKFQTSIKSGLPVVYLQHGLLDSSDTFFVNEESCAPGFMLANKGYDVWVGNSRGNYYSNKHVSLTENDPQFWAFSFDEMAEYDLPAAFSYINNATGQLINYIGHSQGTSIMFAALSQQNQVVKQNLLSFIALAPIAFLNNMTSPALKVITNLPDALFTDLHIYHLLDRNFLSTHAGSLFCGWFQFACSDLLTVFAGKNETYDNNNQYDVIFGHFPSGESSQDLFHYQQLMKNGLFSKYNYGSGELNLAAYGQNSPPDYDLSNIDVDVNMFVGTVDELADPINAEELKNQLVNVPNLNYQVIEGGHATFIWGKPQYMAYFGQVEQIIQNAVNSQSQYQSK